MKCPRCAAFSRLNTPACLHCGFTISELYERLGSECVLLDRVSDSAFCLKVAEKQNITVLMNEFENRFPQMFLCVFLAEIPPTLSLSEFGFWLCNHAAVTEVDYTRPNENGIFLILDILGKRASFSTGYLIEQFLSESMQFQALKAGAGPWEENRMADGIEVCITELEKCLLKSASRFARADFEVYQAPAGKSKRVGDREQLGLRLIRDGHTVREREDEAAMERAEGGDAEPLSESWWEGKE